MDCNLRSISGIRTWWKDIVSFLMVVNCCLFVGCGRSHHLIFIVADLPSVYSGKKMTKLYFCRQLHERLYFARAGLGLVRPVNGKTFMLSQPSWGAIFVLSTPKPILWDHRIWDHETEKFIIQLGINDFWNHHGNLVQLHVFVVSARSTSHWYQTAKGWWLLLHRGLYLGNLVRIGEWTRDRLTQFCVW